MKIICILLIILSINLDCVTPVDLQCSYGYDSWSFVHRIYQCTVQDNLNIISSESTIITGATGSHEGSRNNEDVDGFYANNKTIEIFPRGLEKIYKNLKFISIWYGRIKEIHQSDLKPFSQLKCLNLYENDIEVLEEGLFDFSPKLTVIGFSSNKISQIHPNVFDHLTKLTSLWLNGNQCINKNVDNNSTGLKILFKQVQLQCPSPSVEYRVQKLKLNIIDLDFQLTEKLTNIEKTCQNSFLELSTKISKLEATSRSSNEETQALNSKIQSAVNFIKAAESRTLKIMDQNMQILSQKIEVNDRKLKIFYDSVKIKFDKLENALKTNEQNHQTLKSEIFAAFGKILEKLEENAAKIEEKTAQKIEEMSTNLKESQILSFSSLNEEMKNLKAGLTILQSELSMGKTVDSSCGFDLSEDHI